MNKQPQFGFLVSAASGLVLLTAGIFGDNQSITIIGSALTTGNAILISQRQDDQDSDPNDNSPTQPLNPNPQGNPPLTTTKIPSGALAANKADPQLTIPSQSKSPAQPKSKSTPSSQSKSPAQSQSQSKSKPPAQLKPKPTVKHKPIL